MQIKIALPKGRLLNQTAKLATLAGWQLNDYSDSARLYRLNSFRFPDFSGKILHEKDIPIQVAIGNYDIGICGLDWIQELVSKFPASNLVKIKDLGFGKLSLFLAASPLSGPSTLESLQTSDKVIRIASEYPNLAESIALHYRFKYFNIFPVWGAPEIYPPENADLALICSQDNLESLGSGLFPVARVINSSACLIANKVSLETKDLSEILNTLLNSDLGEKITFGTPLEAPPSDYADQQNVISPDYVRLALPDGHQQKHMVNILNKAGIAIDDYPSMSGNRRPEIKIPGIKVKVTRPQDMPLQVANGNFDIAVTGKDWVKEHLYQFPSSPVKELVDLKYGWVRIVAAIHNDLPVTDIVGLRKFMGEKNQRIRIASEYTRIADKYARDNHLGMYRIIPTWGATEAFLPDDADILIENTETGGTLKRHNLKIIETLFESTACLIVNTNSLGSNKAATIKALAATLQKAVD